MLVIIVFNLMPQIRKPKFLRLKLIKYGSALDFPKIGYVQMKFAIPDVMILESDLIFNHCKGNSCSLINDN